VVLVGLLMQLRGLLAAHGLKIVKGTETCDRASDQALVASPFPRSDEARSMLFAVLYLIVRRLFGLAGGSGSEDLSRRSRSSSFVTS